jgi:hypothetical protein
VRKSIIRAPHDREHPYIVFTKAIVADQGLSLAERGFLVSILSLPDDWSFSIRGLAKMMHLGKNTAQRYLEVLRKAGYCVRGPRERDSRGRLGRNVYTIYEHPSLIGAPCPQNGDMEREGSKSPKSPCPHSPDMEKRDTTKYLSYRLNTASPSAPPAREPPPSKKKSSEQAVLTTLFFEKYRGHLGVKPAWGAKEGALLKRDIARLGAERLGQLVNCFFGDCPPVVERFAGKAGRGYNVFHSQIDKLLADERNTGDRLRLVRACPSCGKQQEHTGPDCVSCGKALKEAVGVS